MSIPLFERNTSSDVLL